MKNFIVFICVGVIIGICIIFLFRKNDKVDMDINDNTDTVFLIRDSIRNSNNTIDSLKGIIDSLKNKYHEKADYVDSLTDDSAVLFFRDYIETYKK